MENTCLKDYLCSIKNRAHYMAFYIEYGNWVTVFH